MEGDFLWEDLIEELIELGFALDVAGGLVDELAY